MADWILQAREVRDRLQAETRAKHEAAVQRHYLAAIQTLTDGKERICIPVAFAPDVAKLLIKDGCTISWVAEQSGNTIYKVDF